MEDLLPYIIVGAIFLLILYSMMRNQDESAQPRGQNRDYRQRGVERPRYDSPEIRGEGRFGDDEPTERNDRLDWLKGRPGGRTGSNSSRSTNDSPEIEGRGGFGRDKG